MKGKAYIVANEQQEREVLIDLENQGYTWDNLVRSKPTLHVHKLFDGCEGFPYALFANENNHRIRWDKVELSNGLEIVYDGRKEGKMKISKEVYDALVEWRRNKILINNYVWYTDIETVPEIVKEWWIDDFVDTLQTNNRLIAILRWVNGEDVFEVEKPKKWVVRSKGTDTGNDHVHIAIINMFGVKTVKTFYDVDNATKFDTKEEAESWANSHQEVIEVDE